jgi:putative endonuclease
VEGAVVYYVHILASARHGTLYIGVTNNPARRLAQHKTGKGAKFAQAYKVFRLVYVEGYDRPSDAIAREKQLKKWNRDWKIRLIEADNPEWSDLSALLVQGY